MEHIFGIHPVMEAIKTGKKIDKILVKKGLDGPMAEQLLAKIASNRIPMQEVPLEKLDRTVRGAHQGVIALIAEIEYIGLEEMVEKALKDYEAPIFVILDGVTDVRNLGAIARSLECAGGCGIIVQSKGGAAINADAIKASAGALMRIDTCRVDNLKMAAYYLLQNGFNLVAATEKTDSMMYDADMTGPTAIIVGSEGHGISPQMLKIASSHACIPMAGRITSLNVSVATSIILYEAVRQRIMQ